MLNGRLSDFIEQNRILEENQAGFRRNCIQIMYCTCRAYSNALYLFCAKLRTFYFAPLWITRRLSILFGEVGYSNSLNKALMENSECSTSYICMCSNIKSCVLANGQQSQFFCSSAATSGCVRDRENLLPLFIFTFMSISLKMAWNKMVMITVLQYI